MIMMLIKSRKWKESNEIKKKLNKEKNECEWRIRFKNNSIKLWMRENGEKYKNKTKIRIRMRRMIERRIRVSMKIE